MEQPPLASEEFLKAFHAIRPGLTPRAFANTPVRCGESTWASSYAALIHEVPTVPSPLRVLDLACGDGHLLGLLVDRRQHNLSLYGIDFSHAELQLARRTLPASVSLIEGNAQNLPFREKSFEIVTCHLALMLMGSVDLVLDEVHRVLAPGGKFVAVVGAEAPPSLPLDAYRALFEIFPRHESTLGVRFGDKRLRSDGAIFELLAGRFLPPRQQTLSITRRLTPEESWLYFLDMYDLALLPPDALGFVRQHYLSSLAVRSEPQEPLVYYEQLRLFVAIAA
jgi:SAM-dependent methyltransferase